jgi:hypothetical protein
VHIRQPLQDGRAVNGGQVRREQVVHGGGRHGSVIDCQRLHHFLRVHVQTVEGFAYVGFHYFFWQDRQSD